MVLGLAIQMLVLLLVVALLIWAVDQIPGLPPPIQAVAKVILVVVACLGLLRMAGIA